MALIVDSVTHSYGGRSVLRDLSLRVETGELVTLAGPSGCGKSTLLRLIAGLEKPDAGGVWLDDADITARPGHVGLVFQEASLYPWLTVADNVAFGLRLQRAGRARIGQRVTELLDLTGLHEAARLYPNQLSGGMAQRAALARALAPEPDVLLLDEPFTAVDLLLRAHLQAEVLRIWERIGTTILLVTHSIDEAVAMGNRVLLVSEAPGRIIHEVPVPLPHPRTDGDPAFRRIREQVLGSVGRAAGRVGGGE